MRRSVPRWSVPLLLVLAAPATAESVDFAGTAGFSFRLDTGGDLVTGRWTTLTVTLLRNDSEIAAPTGILVHPPEEGNPMIACTTGRATSHAVETRFSFEGAYRLLVEVDLGPSPSCASWRADASGETVLEVRAPRERLTPALPATLVMGVIVALALRRVLRT